LIESNPEHFRTLIAENVQFVLVDEYQDTDPRQYKILKHVLGGLKQVTNSLFIVGDPKQSIYLFRDADVTLFKKTEEVIRTRLGGDTEYLDTNFRSTPEIVTFTNAVFASLFSSASKPWEFGFTPANCSREHDAGSVQLMFVANEDLDIPTSWFEAEAVARKIDEICRANQKTVSWDFNRANSLRIPDQRLTEMSQFFFDAGNIFRK